MCVLQATMSLLATNCTCPTPKINRTEKTDRTTGKIMKARACDHSHDDIWSEITDNIRCTSGADPGCCKGGVTIIIIKIILLKLYIY